MSKLPKFNKSRKTSSIELTLNCEIIEIFNDEKHTQAKLKFNPGMMNIVIDPDEHHHLGDKINIAGKLIVEKFEQDISEAITNK